MGIPERAQQLQNLHYHLRKKAVSLPNAHVEMLALKLKKTHPPLMHPQQLSFLLTACVSPGYNFL